MNRFSRVCCVLLASVAFGGCAADASSAVDQPTSYVDPRAEQNAIPYDPEYEPAPSADAKAQNSGSSAEVQAVAQAVVEEGTVLNYKSIFGSSFPMPYSQPIPVGSVTVAPLNEAGLSHGTSHPVQWEVFRVVSLNSAIQTSGNLAVTLKYVLANNQVGDLGSNFHIYYNPVSCLSTDPANSYCVAIAINYFMEDANHLDSNNSPQTGLPSYLWSRIEVSLALSSNLGFSTGGSIKVYGPSDPLDITNIYDVGDVLTQALNISTAPTSDSVLTGTTITRQ